MIFLDKQTKTQLHIVAFSLAMVGALIWGWVGLFGLDMIVNFMESMPVLAKLFYMLIGASGVYVFATHKSDCKTCSTMMKK